MTRTASAAVRDVRQITPASGFGSATLAMFLADGGDANIRPDPLTGRTKYGTPAGPAPEEIWFSSSTASAIDRRGFAAASATLGQFLGAGPSLEPIVWFDRLRERILALFGIGGAEAILCGSGTEAELIALSIAQARAKRPLTNIVVGPTETGSSVQRAAAGRHFFASASRAERVECGARLRGFEGVFVECVAIRDPSGQKRSSGEVDEDAAACVRRARASDRDVLLRVLDTSTTGLAGVTRQAARTLAADGHVQVVVDACQLRCPEHRVRADLEAGFMIMITGSKFAGGPPFAGALLLPPGIAKSLAEPGVPAGLSSYSALLDWPSALRQIFAACLATPFNLGLGLRWEAALATIEPFFTLPESLRSQICAWFAAAVQEHIAARPHLRSAERPDSTISPVLTGAAKPAETLALYAGLSAPVPDRPADLARRCHVGQPVAIGEAAALRICASMPLVLDIAAHIAEGQAIDSAPVAGDLALLFRKWDRLAGC